MQLTGSVAGATARVLFDSGAEQHNYISAAFCARNGVTLRDSKNPLQLLALQVLRHRLRSSALLLCACKVWLHS